MMLLTSRRAHKDRIAQWRSALSERDIHLLARNAYNNGSNEKGSVPGIVFFLFELHRLRPQKHRENERVMNLDDVVFSCRPVITIT